MALTRGEIDRRLGKHFGFEAQDNAEGVLITLTANVEHGVAGGFSHSHDGARSFYEAPFANLSKGKV